MSKARTKRTADRLQRLFSGAYDDGPAAQGARTADALLLPGADPRALDALTLDASSLVVAPAGTPVRRDDVGGAEVLAYEGGSVEEDDELLLDGGLVVAVSGYIAAAFVPLSCPTAIRMTGTDDYASFVEDADLAVDSGAFADLLVHPLAMLGDVCGLGTEHTCAAPRRRRAIVGTDGVARPSLGGESFADGDGAATACTACVGGRVPGDVLNSARESRPWLSRYLLVLEVLQMAGDRFGPLEVSGFGHRLNPGLSGAPVEDTMAPVLLRAGDQHLVCDLASRRMLRSGADAARVLEVALAHAGDDLAEEVARHLDLPRATAASAVAEMQATFHELGFPLRIAEPA